MSRGKTIDAFGARSKPTAKPAPPPKVRPTVDERAEKAERQAHAQHSTSLLSKESASSHGRRAMAVTARGGGYAEKRGMPFMVQLLIVMLLAGGVAFGISIYAPDLMSAVL